MSQRPFGWVALTLPGVRRWECDCGAQGMRSIQDPWTKVDRLRDHFDRMHDGRGTIVHGPHQCKGRPCPFHNPSMHPMALHPKLIRYDRVMLVERLCSHGIGHPDPDSLVWVNERRKELGWDRDDGTHGCDGCCARRVDMGTYVADEDEGVRYIPGKSEADFKELIRDMLREGNYPGPAAVIRRLRARYPFRYGRRSNSHSLSGRECRWREEVFLEQGWNYVGGIPSWRPRTPVAVRRG